MDVAWFQFHNKLKKIYFRRNEDDSSLFHKTFHDQIESNIRIEIKCNQLFTQFRNFF